MMCKMGISALGKLAQELRTILGRKATEEQLVSELDRFVNHYGLRVEEAWRAVLVLHGIPPGLTGPADRHFTWQPSLDAFVGT
jgi:hypothetical protein